MSQHTSDGSTAEYYKLPADCTELQHLISHRNLNAQDGEIFRAIYRKGMASHSDELRDAKKVLFYAKAEVERLEKLRAVKTDKPEWPDESRIDAIGQNGGDPHYDDMPSEYTLAEVVGDAALSDWAEWVAVDADGLVFEYEKKANDQHTMGTKWNSEGSSRYRRINKVAPPLNFRKCIWKIDKTIKPS